MFRTEPDDVSNRHENMCRTSHPWTTEQTWGRDDDARHLARDHPALKVRPSPRNAKKLLRPMFHRDLSQSARSDRKSALRGRRRKGFTVKLHVRVTAGIPATPGARILRGAGDRFHRAGDDGGACSTPPNRLGRPSLPALPPGATVTIRRRSLGGPVGAPPRPSDQAAATVSLAPPTVWMVSKPSNCGCPR